MLTVAALASCDPDAEALYSNYYGAPLPYARLSAGYGYAAAAPAIRTIARPAIAAPVAVQRTIAAPVAVQRTIAAPVAVQRTIAAPVAQVNTIAAPAIAQVNTIAAPVAQVQAAVPSVTSSQFHAQDEDKNFSFGYSNINSARQESGNALTGVVGSYSNGHNTINYVADAYGYRTTSVL